MTTQEFIAILFTAKTFDFDQGNVKSFKLACEENIAILNGKSPESVKITDLDAGLD